jgi:ankyrin repeat protein
MRTKIQFNLKHLMLVTLITSSLSTMAFNEKSNNLSKEQPEMLNKAQKPRKATPKIDIHTAVLKNDIKTIKEHIAAKTDLNVKESFGGSTPLISAALFGRTEIAKLLINAGANLNIQNNDGSTALITAAFFCRPEIVKMLLAKKANKTIKNNFNQTAYETVLAPFKEMKPVYEALGNALSPMGLKLDFAYLEKTRPVIAKLLK